MKIFILDDELHARVAIKSYLERFVEGDYTVKEAGTINEALAITQSFTPDVAFLDIDLNGGTSFDFLAHFQEIEFRIIFITSHNEYAVKAFRFNAVDYILKPIAPNEFEEALKKVDSARPSSTVEIRKLTSDLKSESIEKIVLKDIHTVHFVEINKIIYCQSENNYTTFFLTDGTEITVSKTLRGYENILKPVGFFRVHRSFLISLSMVKSFDKKEGGTIQMDNGSKIPIARNRRDTFMKVMNII